MLFDVYVHDAMDAMTLRRGTRPLSECALRLGHSSGLCDAVDTQSRCTRPCISLELAMLHRLFSDTFQNVPCLLVCHAGSFFFALEKMRELPWSDVGHCLFLAECLRSCMQLWL